MNSKPVSKINFINPIISCSNFKTEPNPKTLKSRLIRHLPSKIKKSYYKTTAFLTLKSPVSTALFL